MILKKCYLVVFVCWCSVLFSQEKTRILEALKNFEVLKNENFTKAHKYAKQAVFLSEKQKESSLLPIAYYNLASIQYKKDKIKEAEETINKCLKLEINDVSLKSLSILLLSKINRRKNNYDKCLELIETGLKTLKNKNYTDNFYKFQINKAILFKSTKNEKKAFTLLHSLLKKIDTDNSDIIASIHNNIGGIHLLKNKDSSIYYYKKSLFYLKDSKNNYLKRIVHSNLADILVVQKQFKEAFQHLDKAEQIALHLHDYKGLHFINASKAIYYEHQENYTEAVKKYLIAINDYGKYVDNRQKAHLYWLLSGALWHNKQFEEGFEYQEKYIELQDSLFTIDKNRTFEKLQTEYDFAKKNDQIAFLEKEKVLEAKQKKLIYGISGLIGSILLLLVFIYRNRIKSQKIIQKQEQQLFLQEKAQLEQDQKLKHIEGYVAGEEKEKNRIAMELHDGIGGQLSGVKHFVTSLQSTEATNELLQNITDISKEVRLLSHSLSSNFSIQQPLTHLLQTLQQRYKNHFSIEISLFPETAIQKITTDQKVFLYRTIQELINNIYKYAKASSVELSITISEDITLIVEDNGTGFDTTNTANGIGLQNIKERVKTLHGTFEVDSVLQRGTSILIKIPKDHG
ncbi:ATP-binding protein [Tenacibaculum sp. M341]|uniref:ATP-binding protein n=1 Tax=Tenacibaculum sp. M341 TaxID=2530339 RepID=UPI001043C91F|nr:ATP-binding protein [Tenacibaculum sp. M341]TCI84783.1 hypothetical protein EYW44_19825 [Tenacibaculum sp. M341]